MKNNKPIPERRKIRNKMTAADARVRQKRESIFLNYVVHEKDEKMVKLLTYLGNSLPIDQLVAL